MSVYRAFFATFLTVLLATAGNSQYREKIVFWSDNSTCGAKNFEAADTAFPECGILEDPNGQVRFLSFGKLRMLLQFTESSQRFMVRLRVENLGDERIDLGRDNWSVAHYKDEASFKSKETPILNERVSYRPPPRDSTPQIAGPTIGASSSHTEVPGLRRTATSIDAGQVAGGPQQIPAGQQSIAVIPPTSTVSNVSAGTITAKGVPKRSEYFAASEFLTDFVEAGSNRSGVLYFRQVKKGRFKLFIIHIADTSFVFQVMRPSK